jgi:hypothetical protein
MDELVQRLLLAGALGFAMARKAAAILEDAVILEEQDRTAHAHQGAVLRAILDGANECLGRFDERVSGERVSGERVSGERTSGERTSGERTSGEHWCDTLVRLLDLATFAREVETRISASG